MIHARHALAGAILTSAMTIAGSAGAQCKDSTDCRAGRVCNQGHCVELRCTKDVECPANGVCEAGVCRAAALASPAPLAPRAAPPQAPPPELYRTERRLIPGLYITGPVLLGSMWITTIAVTASVSAKEDVGRATGYAAIPVFGPWVMLGSSLDTSSYVAPLVLSGILQSAGLALTITGFTVRRERRVPVVATRSGVTFTVVPSATGAAAVGTF